MTHKFKCPHCDRLLEAVNDSPGDRFRALTKHRRNECVM